MKYSEMTEIPEIIREFLLYMQTIRGKSEKTVGEYYLDLRTFFRFLNKSRGLVSPDVDFEEIPINNVDIEYIKTVTLMDAYEFMNFCLSERSNNAKTRARKSCSLRMFFKYLTNKVQKLENNPLEQLETPKIGKSLPKYLTLEESKTLLESVDGQFKERDYCIISLFLNCGLRLNELCGLNLGDIDQNKITVTGKGNKQRIVYLNDACVNAVNMYLPVRTAKLTKVKDKNALFLSRLGNRISDKTVQHIIYQNLDKAGLGGKGLSVHKLRHTAATLMYQYGGVDIRVLKEILGHENLGTTEIYTHLSAKQLESAAESNPLSKEKMKNNPQKK